MKMGFGNELVSRNEISLEMNLEMNAGNEPTKKS